MPYIPGEPVVVEDVSKISGDKRHAAEIDGKVGFVCLKVPTNSGGTSYSLFFPEYPQYRMDTMVDEGALAPCSDEQWIELLESLPSHDYGDR